MDEVRDRARLADASAFDGRAVTATVPRADIEGVLASADGPPELVLDIERRDGADVEAHTLRIEWDPEELRELLRTTDGEQVNLVLDREELERVLLEDVEAHGLREKAAVFAVAAVAAAGAAGQATAATGPSIVTDGGGASGTTPIAIVSDAGEGGYATTAQAPQLVADSALSGQAQHAMTPQEIVDAAAGPAQMVSDPASSGPVTQPAEASGGGGWSISAPDPTTTGAIAGGVAVMIAAAGFAARGQRKRLEGHPA